MMLNLFVANYTEPKSARRDANYQMHASSKENMLKCFERYIQPDNSEARVPSTVLDVGGAEINGSYSDIFKKPLFEYIGADLEAGEGVSVVLEDPYKLPFENESFDIVLSGQMLEHCEYFWKAFEEMVRVVKPQGFIFLIAPSAGPIHKFPVDCYRYYPDAYKALARLTGCNLIDCWLDSRGPWRDLVGVFSKSDHHIPTLHKPCIDEITKINSFSSLAQSANDRTSGALGYLNVLKHLHELLAPENYLEIGVRHGRSLALAKQNSIGVDPVPEVKHALSDRAKVIELKSDDFFEQYAQVGFKQPPRLVFIDGMHLIENVIRDFMHVEQIATPDTVVVIDDVLPNLPIQASRDRQSKVWTGDVWKIYLCLQSFRPDLKLLLLDTEPTGMLVITRLNPKSRVLWNQYNPIVRKYIEMDETPPEDVINRVHSVAPSADSLRDFLKASATGPLVHSGHLTERNSESNQPTTSSRPRLSVVLITYNMRRELPRTLKSLSPEMQKGISADDYEIIVVDNGSDSKFDLEECALIASNARFVFEPSGNVSPVDAINRGLSLAKGEFAGVMIDGARMASPGLLAEALVALSAFSKPLVGTLAFHLGEEVQMQSVQNGYNQAVEDELLASVDWQEDGYRLFDISVFAGSSRKGWFQLPSESNAIFMKKQTWDELEGFDPQFKTVGGGLVNLDTWTRACHLEQISVTILLGEGTFHQFHGGVATNSLNPPMSEFKAEYLSIRGHPFTPPVVPFKLAGAINGHHIKTLITSVENMRSSTSLKS